MTDCLQPIQEFLRTRYNLPNLVLEAIMNADQFAHCFKYIGKILHLAYPNQYRNYNMQIQSFQTSDSIF